MISYLSGIELIERIRYTHLRLDEEFDDLTEVELHVRLDGVDRTPYEILAYLLGWLQLVQQWEQAERRGEVVITPTATIRWNELGKLYAGFYEQYKDGTLEQLRQELRRSVQAWCQWIAELSEQELFGAGQRQWTANQAAWPLWKWLHINSVAPFQTFRTRIRKWKKIHVLHV
ncbi:ClbS/DfsB family four-helix bundle protein [Paenibacillus wenxiniae]|uniref:ClbS/DfsB family four-helix bundle protein n=1 Tax=Paenibacillus wenxiniae TaxID=1636843 RepID=A0ABW4RLZ5_9BACL